MLKTGLPSSRKRRSDEDSHPAFFFSTMSRLTNPVDGAVLLFRGESAEVAENFARTDPYVLNGLIKEWRVREWTTVVGAEAATPLV